MTQHTRSGGSAPVSSRAAGPSTAPRAGQRSVSINCGQLFRASAIVRQRIVSPKTAFNSAANRSAKTPLSGVCRGQTSATGGGATAGPADRRVRRRCRMASRLFMGCLRFPALRLGEFFLHDALLTAIRPYPAAYAAGSLSPLVPRLFHQWRKAGPGIFGKARPRVQAPSLPGCQGNHGASRTPCRTAHMVSL